ncbi:MAG: AAA family ATPase [Nitrosopumilaceae archaeon]|nr:AAA family ATPase [Nitrosopumilaceae archaeon]NIU87815.1 AAA family ATPase [Nitrosopumilaceae archaeon]NIV65197.1 AAA family ATPase [Nitrosopumilaceae archaeon]NIX61713.1 AAA family ATPase [Nitrosopumilaceae archaeon]
MSLYHKYRPSSFEEVIGNKSTITSLRSLINNNEPPHAFLLHGPSGCGKTTLARLIAKELKCYGSDFREIDSADFRGIDTIRRIRDQAKYLPLESKSRVWLLDEAHQIGGDAQHALLKALEEAQQHVYYILCTTHLNKLLPTIRGRCVSLQVEPLKDELMMKLIRRVVRSEGQHISREVIDQIIDDAEGSPRNALQILDQVLVVDEDQRLIVAKQAVLDQAQVVELCRALLMRDKWKKVSRILTSLKGEDPERVRRAVLGYCSSVLLKKSSDQAGIIMEEFKDPFFNSGFSGLVFACYSIICGAD